MVLLLKNMRRDLLRLRAEARRALTCPRHVIHYTPFKSRLIYQTKKQPSEDDCFFVGARDGT